MDCLLYLLIGIPVGMAGALLGIGGGIVIVPVLTFIMGFSPLQAVGTSMVVVMLNSISGAVGYLRKKMVCLKAALLFSIASVPGALLGGYVSDFLRGRALFLIFGIFFCWLSVKMFFKSTKKDKIDQSTKTPENFNWKLGSACSIAIGFAASILGIGGGVFHVPMMNSVLKFPYKVAVATSTFILALTAVAGSLSHAYMGHVIWEAALSLGAGAIIGAQLGVKLSPKAKSSVLLKVTAVIILATGIKFFSAAL